MAKGARGVRSPLDRESVLPRATPDPTIARR